MTALSLFSSLNKISQNVDFEANLWADSREGQEFFSGFFVGLGPQAVKVGLATFIEQLKLDFSP